MVVVAIVLSIVGLLTAFLVVGILPSIIAFCLSLTLFLKEKTINLARAAAISLAGIILPLVMYFNSYGLSLPYDKNTGLNTLSQIIYDNYSNLGLDMSFLLDDIDIETVEFEKKNIGADGDEIYYVSKGASVESLSEAIEVVSDTAPSEEENEDAAADGSSERKGILNEVFFDEDAQGSIFESIDSLDVDSEGDYGAQKKGASDDDIPSYGGLPMGTILLGQYFREDDHNCNPILVLQNKTDKAYRYECKFIARDAEGEEIAQSEKTVEVVKADAKFVFEGRFDKADLEGQLPDMYEFSVTRRSPYETDMSDEVVVSSMLDGSMTILTANNTSDKRVKVDAYVLYFDKEELVDCIWMIPQNTGEVCIDPGSTASIKGIPYYRFDRTETYYTAYEAVGE